MTDFLAGIEADIPVLDLEGACEFLELSRKEIMVLVPEALREIDSKLALVRSGLDSGELPDAGRNAHIIKSVAASIGAQRVSQLAFALETAAQGLDSSLCTSLLSTLEEEAGQLTEAVSRL